MEKTAIGRRSGSKLENNVITFERNIVTKIAFFYRSRIAMNILVSLFVIPMCEAAD